MNQIWMSPIGMLDYRVGVQPLETRVKVRVHKHRKAEWKPGLSGTVLNC